MRADYPVVLDACVLIPMPLADTLLRMAEAPRLYLPRWSTHHGRGNEESYREVEHAVDKARRREAEICRHFPEAWVEGFEPFTQVMTNDPGDRHVLAAALRAHAELIVTYNRRHFPHDSVRPWNIEVQGPSTFLRGLYDLEAGLFVSKLHEQAEQIGIPLEKLLLSLSKSVPKFIEYFWEEQGIRFPE